jgi:hypothetical protein
MSVGLAIAIEPGAAQASAGISSFAGKLQALHEAINSRQLMIDPIQLAPSAADGSHAVKLMQQAQWNNSFRKYHPGFAQ